MNRVPRILHRTYRTRDLPPELARAAADLVARNPQFEHRFYDDSDVVAFIREEFGAAMLDAYHAIDPAYTSTRANLFRYLAIYRCGGVYLDIKATATKPLEQVAQAAETHFPIGQWEQRWWHPLWKWRGWGRWPAISHVPGGEYQQWWLAAPPGHQLIGKVIDYVVNNIAAYDFRLHGVGRQGSIYTTGPVAYTLAIHPHLESCPHRFVHPERDLGLIYSVFAHGGAEYHKKFFDSHYTNQSRPVVARDPNQRPLGDCHGMQSSSRYAKPS